MSDEEYLGGLRTEATRLVSQSQILLAKDLPGLEGREELSQEADGLVNQIDNIYTQSGKSLWEAYIDVMSNIAMLLLRQGQAEKAARTGEKAISTFGEGPRYPRLFEDKLRGAKLVGVTLQAFRAQGVKPPAVYSSMYPKIYRGLGEGPQDEVNEFLRKSGRS